MKTYSALNIQFFSFELVSKRSGNRFEMKMWGTDLDDARDNLLAGWLKNQDWNQWTLEDK